MHALENQFNISIPKVRLFLYYGLKDFYLLMLSFVSCIPYVVICAGSFSLHAANCPSQLEFFS